MKRDGNGNGGVMNGAETPMWSDPAEAPYVRELLQAGRSAEGSYDVASGLTQHLARVQAGAPLPQWAKAGTSLGKVAAWLAVPMIGASVMTAVWLSHAGSPRSGAASAPSAPTNAVATGVVNPIERSPIVAAPTPSAGQAPILLPSVALSPVAETTHRKLGHTSSKSGRIADLSGASSAKVLDTSAISATSATTGSPVSPSARTASATGTVSATSASHSLSGTLATPAARVVLHDTASQPAAQPQAQAAESEAVVQPTAAEQRKQVDESRLEREMQMLAVAQRVLASDPARALRLTQQGEHEFPSSMFSAEREQVGLLALVKLGRLDEARRIGQSFLAKYPNAPWSQRLRHALATGHVE